MQAKRAPHARVSLRLQSMVVLYVGLTGIVWKQIQKSMGMVIPPFQLCFVFVFVFLGFETD